MIVRKRADSRQILKLRENRDQEVRILKAAFLTLGCKVNSYETDRMRMLFENEGFESVSFEEPADVYVVNTCTVTNIADRKSRQMIRRARKKSPGAVVVAAGCYVDSSGRKALEGEDVICIGNSEKEDVIKILKAFRPGLFVSGGKDPSAENQDMTSRVEKQSVSFKGKKQSGFSHNGKSVGFTESPYNNSVPNSGNAENGGNASGLPSGGHASDHIRADVEIQNGCNQFCTYCIIPFVRGHLKSRRQEDVLDEIRGLAGEGFKEIVITGIHLSSYGITEGITDRDGKKITSSTFVELKGRPLVELLEAADRVDGIERIRLGSLEPRIITYEFAEALSKIRKFCPHFHLSLQSGCDKTLKSMNRHYTTDEYMRGVEILNSVFDRPNITTDIIVGFPGETEEDFEESAEFAKKAGFADVHVFRYSGRPGTVAYKRADQVPEEIKSERSRKLIEVRDALRVRYASQFEGDMSDVLLEQIKEENDGRYATGYTKNYLKVRVRIPEKKDGNKEPRIVNTIKNVRLDKFDGTEFEGMI